MAFGQKTAVRISSWGVAPGYGEDGLRPRFRSAHAQLRPSCSAGENGCDRGKTWPVANTSANQAARQRRRSAPQIGGRRISVCAMAVTGPPPKDNDCEFHVRAKKPKRLPVVFTPEEAMAVVEELQGFRWLMGMLLYGGGLRLMECFRLRVKDVDFDRLQVIVREGKGDKDRVPLLPKAAVDPLKRHLVQVREAHERAVREGFAGVELPYALARKYPNLGRELVWQYAPSSIRRNCILGNEKLRRRSILTHLRPSVADAAPVPCSAGGCPAGGRPGPVLFWCRPA